MAQSGFTPIQLYRTTTASAAPSAGNLADGELAINTNDGRLFYKDSGGVVRAIASTASTSGVFTVGTVSAPGITFSGDTNTGIFSPAADTIAFTEGGVESMRIDASGNVGIGTSSPTQRLHVSGSSGITTQIIQSTGSVAARFNLQTTNDANGFINYDTGNWIFFNNSAGSAAERMRITADGNVGIGLVAPTFKLQLFSAGATTFVGSRVQNDAVAIDQSVGNGFSRVWNSTNHPMIFGTNDAERMRIDASGNVGIGTSAPGTRLNVVTSDGVTNSRFAGASFAVRIQSIAGVGAQLEATNNNEATYQPLLVGGSQVQFTTSGAERMRITAAGNVGIGTSSPNYLFTSVGGSVQLSPGTSAQEGTRLTRSTGVMTFNGINNDNNAYNALAFATGASEAMRIDTSGNVGIGTTTPGSLLQLNKGSGAADMRLSVAGTLYGLVYASSSDMTINSVTAIPLAFGTNNTTRFQIGPSGQFGVGGANYGTSGQVLTSNGSGAAPSWQSVGGTANGLLLNVQVFTSSGTYTRTAGVTRAVVIAVGGGGGGGGTGGAAGTGGTTSFGSHVTAVGGLGGTGAATYASGGAGGTGGTGATIAIRGASGGWSNVIGSGCCGTSWGSGFGGGQGGGLNGAAGVRGGGGGGRIGLGTGGGGGGQGETAIDYISSGLGATETVTIGAGGAGGNGVGGAGGAGYVIVYEYS